MSSIQDRRVAGGDTPEQDEKNGLDSQEDKGFVVDSQDVSDACPCYFEITLIEKVRRPDYKKNLAE